MEVLYLLIPMSLVLVFIIGGIFWWSLRQGQFDDLEGPGYRILMDDDSPKALIKQTAENSHGTDDESVGSRSP